MNGSYVSHGGTLHLTQGEVKNSGVWTLDPGDRVLVDRGLRIASTESAEWSTAAGELIFTGDGGFTPTLGVSGVNRGRNASGYSRNFAWGRLELAAGLTLILKDATVAIPGGAVYVHELALDGGLAQVNAIVGNGLSIYYDSTRAANAYLGGQTYPLIAGGSLATIALPVPEPAGAALLWLAVRPRRRDAAEGDESPAVDRRLA